jgi:demethylmenaquinone methyltransferase/2-methoxy-6-polyprenyl-1,4-benzoquinol methylase
MVQLRGDEKRRYVAGLFLRISPRYDLMNAVMTFGMDRLWRRRAAQEAMRGLDGPALDVATGTGDLALALARTPGVTKVVGVDLLEPMVTRARRKVAKARGVAPTSFLVGDALTLPFDDGTFACVTSAFSLRNMPNLEESLVEMLRVVRPGGRLLSLETMPGQKGVLKPLVRFHFRRVVPILGAILAADKAAYTYLPRSVDEFLSPDELSELLGDLGLGEVGHRPMAQGSVHLHWGTKAL